MFEDTATELFKKAGVSPEKNPGLFDEAVSILNQSMALLSATMGLSYERVDRFNEQKTALVDDLRKGLDEGWVAS